MSKTLTTNPKKTPMTNFKRYKRNLTLEKFADLILFDCDVCPAHPCMDEVPDDPDVCTEMVIKWGNKEIVK